MVRQTTEWERELQFDGGGYKGSYQNQSNHRGDNLLCLKEHCRKHTLVVGNNLIWNQILVTQSLIRREGHLIVVDDGRQAAEGEDAAQLSSVSRNDRILAVAPNYVIDWLIVVLAFWCLARLPMYVVQNMQEKRGGKFFFWFFVGNWCMLECEGFAAVNFNAGVIHIIE